jgi:hypothetical protein
MDIVAVTTTGQETILEFPISTPHVCEEGTKIQLRFVERCLEFPLGAPIDIPPKALAEQCFLMSNAAREILRSALEYAAKNNIRINIAHAAN